MKKYVWSILMLVLAACSGNGYDESEGYVVSPLYIAVQQRMEVASDAATVELKIEANCEWTITANADWLAVDRRSAKGEQTVTLTISRNTTASQRTALLTVSNAAIRPRPSPSSRRRHRPQNRFPDAMTTCHRTNKENKSRRFWPFRDLFVILHAKSGNR